MTLELQRSDIHVLAPSICFVAPLLPSLNCHAAAAFGVASAAAAAL